MSFVLPLDILADVSLVLIEAYVNTELGTAVGAPGPATVTPGSMVGIYEGAQVVVARGGANQELIAVTAVTPTTFTAVFAKIHGSTDALNGATFSSRMFTQQEMLEYLLHAEGEFLLKTRPVYATATQPLSPGAGNRYYPQPADAIRIERIASEGEAWMDTTTSILDLDNPNWQADHTSAVPRAWFQDDIGLDKFGIWPTLDIGGVVAEIWYSQKDINPSFSFLSPFILPDIFTMYLKYGVLARAFAKDGEQRDATRAQYCSKRFEFGVFLARTFLLASEALVREMQDTTDQQKKFSPLAVPAQAAQ